MRIALPTLRAARVLLIPAVFVFVSTVSWASTFVAVPAADKPAKSLQLRIVRYTGGTNGEMIIEVKNTGRRVASFSAEGLYFVPEGDPEKAPQRLGAAGPFLVQRGGTWTRVEQTSLAARATAQLKLQVFCIDSHRASPGADQPFRLAAKRLPKALRSKIEGGAKHALKRYRGVLPAAKSAIQSTVWQARDEKWIKLDGERAQEKSLQKRHKRPRPQRLLKYDREPVQQTR